MAKRGLTVRLLVALMVVLMVEGVLGGCSLMEQLNRPRYEQPPVASYSTATWEVTADSFTEKVDGAAVSAEFFPASKALPYLGRFFHAEEHERGREWVVVLSHEFWQRHYGSPDGIGRQIRLNDQPMTIIGVAPPGFAIPERAALWVPRAE
jgi:hypothetical protein